MKKLLILLLTIVMLCSLFACSDQSNAPSNDTAQGDRQQEQILPPESTPASSQASADDTDPITTYTVDASVSWANWSDDPKINELALNKELLTGSSIGHLPIYRCSTPGELSEFKAAFSGILTMDGAWDEIPSFEDVTAEHSEDFFSENDLLLVYVTASSCTPRFGVDSVLEENGTLSVYIKHTYDPESGDTAMAGWLFTVPLSKDLIQDCTGFDAVLN